MPDLTEHTVCVGGDHKRLSTNRVAWHGMWARVLEKDVGAAG